MVGWWRPFDFVMSMVIFTLRLSLSSLSVSRGCPGLQSCGSILLLDGVVPLFPLLCLVILGVGSSPLSSVLVAVPFFEGFGRGEEFKTSPRVAAHPSRLGAPQEVRNFPASPSSSELSSHQISLRAHSGVCTTAAERLSHCVPPQVHSLTHRKHRGTTCTRRESATTAYFGCTELLLPPRPFRAAPSSPASLSLFHLVTRAMVHVSRARQGPAPDPTPYVLDKHDYASTSSTRARACWWIPAGGKARLCCHH